MPVRVMTIEEWWAANPLAAWRKRTGTTRDVVCARAGVTTSAVVKWERGGSVPTPENMARLAAIMDTDVEALTATWERWSARKRE